jgi:DNA gyrase subunit A
MATRKGVVKKTRLSEYDTRLKGGIIALKLGKEDELEWVAETDGKQEIMLVTTNGMAIRFSEEEVRAMGRTATGVRGIRLRKGDSVIGMGLATEDRDVLVATLEGYGKRTAISEYRKQGRGGIGIKTLNITKRNGPVMGMRMVSREEDLLIITTGGQVIRQLIANIRRIGRSTQGVRLIRLGGGDQVAGIARVVTREDAE